MECPVCYIDYNLKDQAAIKLACCHTLCLLCCKDQISTSNKISCPQCFKVTEKNAIHQESDTIKRIISARSGVSNNNNFESKANTKNNVIKILVRNFRNRFIDLTINENSTVLQLKQLVKIVEGVEENSQWLLFNGAGLDDDKKISDYNIIDGSIVTLVMRSFGG